MIQTTTQDTLKASRLSDDSGGNQEPTTACAGLAKSPKFTAREDDGTGLYYDRARYYHPVLERFVSEDPLEFVDGPNFYGYVENDPVNAVDPFGLTNDPADFGGPVLPPGIEFFPDPPTHDVGQYGRCMAECLGVPIVILTSEHVGAGHAVARGLARTWYGLTDRRFIRWGKYSRVLVPKLAGRIAGVISPLGWGVFAVEYAHCLDKCKKCP